LIKHGPIDEKLFRQNRCGGVRVCGLSTQVYSITVSAYCGGLIYGVEYDEATHLIINAGS
jgi:hypothetical protein